MIAAAGRAFQSFQEGRVDFKPTYRYIPGSNQYDERPDGKLRCPAWCDRILWRVLKPPYHVSDSSSVDGGSYSYEDNPLAGENGIQWARRVDTLNGSGPEEKGVMEKVWCGLYSLGQHIPMFLVVDNQYMSL